jgi:outer membrane receptor protein involved in Fe transport
MSKNIFLIISCILLAVGGLKAQPAEETSDTVKIHAETLLSMSIEDLMNVRVITATQRLEYSGKVPATVVVVTREQILSRGYLNLAEILNDLPDITVHDKSNSQTYNVVSMRGVLGQDHFVILLDGVRISSPTNEPLPIVENFPIYLAKQIEVVYGPGSALYGADALAGVINIITRDDDSDSDVFVTVVGGTQGYTNTNAFFNKTLKNKMRLSVGAQYSYDAQPDFSKVYPDEYKMSGQQTGQFNSAFGPFSPKQSIDPDYAAPLKAYNVYASISNERFALKVLRHYVENSTSSTMRPDNAIYNKDVFYGQGVTMGSASYTADFGKIKSVSTLTGSYYNVNPESNFRNVYESLEHGYKYSMGSMMKAEEQLNYSISKKVNVIGGLTYEHFQSIPKSLELQQPVDKKRSVSGVLVNSAAAYNPGGIEAKFFPLVYANSGAYLQGQYFPSENLSFTAGVRYDNNTRYGSTTNPRVGAVFNPSRKTTVKAMYGTAFWAPSPMVAFESYGSFYTLDSGRTYRSNYWHLPNPRLKPMISRTAELSIDQKVGRQFRITATTYLSHIDNIIKDVPDNGYTNLYNNKFLGWDVDYIEVLYNKGDQRNYGGNVAVNSTFTLGRIKFKGYSSLSYIDGKISESGPLGEAREVEQSVITPWIFRAGIDGRLNAFHFSVRLLHTGKQRTTDFEDYANPVTRKTLPGYSLVNLSTGYSLRGKATFFVNVQNVLNERYVNPLAWDTSNTLTFPGSHQNPIRVMFGIRAGFDTSE